MVQVRVFHKQKLFTGNLDVERRVEKQVLGLEVSMDDSAAVTVRDRRQHLTKPLPRLSLVHSTMSHEVV